MAETRVYAQSLIAAIVKLIASRIRIAICMIIQLRGIA